MLAVFLFSISPMAVCLDIDLSSVTAVSSLLVTKWLNQCVAINHVNYQSCYYTPLILKYAAVWNSRNLDASESSPSIKYLNYSKRMRKMLLQTLYGTLSVNLNSKLGAVLLSSSMQITLDNEDKSEGLAYL
jgi:hypothetical protein